MADIHLDDFYKDVARILLRLYRQFPRKSTLYVDDVCGACEPDEFGLPSERFLSCFSAMVWLADEGYLRFDSHIRQEALDQAVLTEKAFVRLSSRAETMVVEPEQELPPSLQRAAQTSVNQLRQGIKSGSSALLQCAVCQFFSNPS